MLILLASICPAIKYLVLIPLPEIALLQVTPPSLEMNTPPPTTRTRLLLLRLSITSIPVPVSQITLWLSEPERINELFWKDCSRVETLISPVGVITPAALAYSPT